MIENTCAQFNLIATNLTKLSYAISSRYQLCFICLFNPLLRKLISRTFRGFYNITLTVQPMKNGLSGKRKQGFKLFCFLFVSSTHPLTSPFGGHFAVLFMISANITTTTQVWMTGLKNHIGNPLKSVSALSFRPLLAPL